MGLLDDLKKQAESQKAQAVDKTESLRASAVAVDHALRRTFLYLNDLGKQLNAIQMPCPFTFKIPNVEDVNGLIAKDFFVDFRSKHFIDKDYYGEVHVAYRAFSEKVLTVKKGPDEMEKFRDFLWQSNVEHKSEQYRNERKVITHEVFRINCEFRIQAKLDGDHESGKLKIVTKNVGGFDMDIFNVLAQEMNDHAVEEFAKYMIGRPNEWQELVKKSALNTRTATIPPRTQPKVEPKYVVQPEKAPEKEEEEKKGGLFGSIKSVLKKDVF